MIVKCDRCDGSRNFSAYSRVRFSVHRCACGGNYELVKFKFVFGEHPINSRLTHIDLNRKKKFCTYIDKDGKQWCLDLEQRKFQLYR